MKTVILTDIEGTTSSISFVKDVLFPYARERLPAFIAAHGDEPRVRELLDQVAAEHGAMCDDAMIAEVQKYVPGYQLVNGPVFDGNRVSVFMEVEGLGDYLPKYAGNLDIMTAASARTAEMFAEELLKQTDL